MKNALPKKPSRDGKAMGVAVIYARYSSNNQKEASIEQQVSAATRYAEDLGISVIKVYHDSAMSGTNDDRPEFQQMLRDAEKHQFQYVIAWKSNRIGRNMLQAMVNEERLREAGVRCLYVEEDFEDNASGRFALRTMMNVNQFYSENMAEDIKRGVHDNAVKGLSPPSLPYGYTKNKELKILIDEGQASVVREIFTRVIEREQLSEIVRDLNARGIKNRMGRAWGKNSIQRIIKNDRYRGVYRYSDVVKEDGMPRIVTDEMFAKANREISRGNHRGSKSPNGYYALTGKLFCGECGSHMVGVSGTSKTGTIHYYYTCMNRRNGNNCSKSHVRRDEIEKRVADAIVEYCLTDDVIDWIAESTVAYFDRKEEENKLMEIQKQLDKTQKSIDNMMKAIESGIITPSTKDRLTILEQDKATLQSQLALARADILHITKEQIVAGLNLYKRGDVEDKDFRDELFDTFLLAVYVYDDKLKVCFNFTGDKSSVEVKHEDVDDIENHESSNIDTSSADDVSYTNTLYQCGRYHILVIHI